MKLSHQASRRRSRRLGPFALAFLLTVVATAIVSLPAQAKPYRIGINEGSGLNKETGLTRLGPMWVRYSSSRPVRSRRWTLAYAVRAFGKPRSRSGAPYECSVDWRRLGLRIGFRGHQADPANGCLTPRDLFVSEVRIAGRKAKSRFATRRGVRIGTPARTLRRRYPGATRSGNSWVLIETSAFSTSMASLIALTDRGRVVELRAFNHAD